MIAEVTRHGTKQLKMVLLEEVVHQVAGMNTLILQAIGDCGSTVIKVLCYKSEGRWFDPSWCHWNFSLA